MAENLRRVFLEKLDQMREESRFCTIKWSDTKEFQVIPQESIRLPVAQEPEIEVTYTIVIDGIKRYGTVLAAGTKEHCQSILRKYVPVEVEVSDGGVDLVDDLILMKILGKLVNHDQLDHVGDVHDAECATCGMKPIREVDRYHCLECSLAYDLCGRCFEKRRSNGKHFSGHAMVHLKLPNEFLGIHVKNVNEDMNLNQIKQMKTLSNEKHLGIKCDGTCHEKDLIGLRFKCDTCPNYNLCETCALKKRVCTKIHQADHPLILTSNQVIPKIDPNDIQLGEILGRGGFGYVCLSTWKSKRRQVACKVIEISATSSISDNLQRSFLFELAAYRELSGPYILRTYAYATCDLPPTRIHGPKTQLMILMEFMPRGSLQNVLEREPNRISLRRKLSMARQIASGMRRIHQHGMVHRDIRPDNILLTEDYIAKIGDMGIARVLDPKGQHTQVGCLQFMPPEFFRYSDDGFIKCDEKLDIFTYGLTINQLFTELNHHTKYDSTGSTITIQKQSPIFYEDIISKCLENDSKRRPTAIQIEKTLEMYEKAFSETMLTDAYARKSATDKDQIFLQFYQKNHSRIQRFVNEQFPQEFIREIPIQISHQPGTTTEQQQMKDSCRIN